MSWTKFAPPPAGLCSKCGIRPGQTIRFWRSLCDECLDKESKIFTIYGVIVAIIFGVFAVASNVLDFESFKTPVAESKLPETMSDIGTSAPPETALTATDVPPPPTDSQPLTGGPAPPEPHGALPPPEGGADSKPYTEPAEAGRYVTKGTNAPTAPAVDLFVPITETSIAAANVGVGPPGSHDPTPPPQLVGQPADAGTVELLPTQSDDPAPGFSGTATVQAFTTRASPILPLRLPPAPNGMLSYLSGKCIIFQVSIDVNGVATAAVTDKGLVASMLVEQARRDATRRWSPAISGEGVPVDDAWLVRYCWGTPLKSLEGALSPHP
jgi:hypothetical protein